MVKRILIMAMAVALTVCMFTACQQQVPAETSGSVEEKAEIVGMPNPVKEVSGTDEFINPVTVPDGVSPTYFAVIDNTTDELRFEDAGKTEYTLRATQDKIGKDTEAFTGIYGEWTYQEGMGDIRYATVAVDGDSDFYVAYWKSEDNKVFYCLYGPSGSQDKVISYAEEISGY